MLGFEATRWSPRSGSIGRVLIGIVTALATAAAYGADLAVTQTATLRPIWTARLRLDGLTNVVVGRLDGAPRFCVVGNAIGSGHTEAGIELLNGQGRPVWMDRRGAEDLDYVAGACRRLAILIATADWRSSSAASTTTGTAVRR